MPITPLTSLRPGQTAVIAESRLSRDDAALLRAMGLCERTHIRVWRIGEPCVVAVGGMEAAAGGVVGPAPKLCHCAGHCRIGLARRLAEQIIVTVLPDRA